MEARTAQARAYLLSGARFAGASAAGVSAAAFDMAKREERRYRRLRREQGWMEFSYVTWLTAHLLCPAPAETLPTLSHGTVTGVRLQIPCE